MKRRLLFLCLACFAFALFAAPAGPGPEVSRFLAPRLLTGAIYPKASSNSPALFSFRRTARAEGSSIQVLREYFAPDGTLVARESVEYNGNQLRRFVLEQNQIHARGSATLERTATGKTRIQFEYDPDEKKKSTETQADPVLINDTIPDFINEHWEQLMNEENLRFRYVVIPRLETLAFTLRKTGELSGRSLAEIEMRPTNWVLQRLVDPIAFRVELRSSHRIVEYVGRTTPRIHRGRTWDDLDAVTIFDWEKAIE